MSRYSAEPQDPRLKDPSNTHALRATQQHACGKAIIAGEHAVVYGARAVAIPVTDLRLSVELKPLSAGARTQILLNGAPASDNLQGLVTEVFALLDVDPAPVLIQCQSSLPVGAGLGSSASLCIVLLRAIAAAARRQGLDPREFARMGNILERRFHGTPSGLDTTVVAHERAILFQKARESETGPLELPLSSGKAWRFALIDSQVRASTLAMIHRAAPYFTHAEGFQRIAEFDRISLQAAQALTEGCSEALAEAMSTCARHLDAAGVVPPVLHAMMEKALQLGALAAKPTGAGGGGCIITLLEPSRAGDQLAALASTFGPGHVYGVSLPPST